MQAQEIREILSKKDEGKIENYVQKNNLKKADQACLMNLLQTWTHSLLYYKKVYPTQAFIERQLLGVTVFVASSTPLKTYLDGFFADLKPHLSQINHLQIILFSSSNSIIQTNTLHIQNFEQQKLVDEDSIKIGVNTSMQKEIQFKSFIYDLKKKFLKGFVRQSQGVSFRFRVGYQLQQGREQMDEVMAQNWVRRERISGEGQMMGSLKWQFLNVIYEVLH